MQVCVAAAVARAEEGRAGVAVLGLGRADGQAADLAVRAVHHLHKLTTPWEKQERVSGIVTEAPSNYHHHTH